MEKLLTVKDAAVFLDISPDTIRRWDKRGLIKSHRSEKNYRLFNIEEVKRLNEKINYKGKETKFGILKNTPSNIYTVVDLFSGAGGTALGLENAGLSHKLLVEVDKDCVETLRINKKSWNVIHDDISKVSFKGIRADIVEGGFPCQSFSYAGKKKGFEDIRGTLFFEFVRCIQEIRPKVAIGENVKGLLRHDNGRTLKIMIETLQSLGYKVAYRVLRSQYFDVPQKRERLIIIGVREDLDIPILFPKENDYVVTLKDALQNVPFSEGQSYPEKKKKVMDLIPPGGYWKDLPEELQKEYMGASYYMGGGKTGMARRLSWDEPSLTLTTSPAQKQTERCHPDETRPLTMREYARIQTFPDSWKFSGSLASQYKQIGNAVPVNLGFHIGRAVISMLNKEVDENKYEILNSNSILEEARQFALL
jgi:DNA (cytosine-5)-methyltransferase 1